MVFEIMACATCVLDLLSSSLNSNFTCYKIGVPSVQNTSHYNSYRISRVFILVLSTTHNCIYTLTPDRPILTFSISFSMRYQFSYLVVCVFLLADRCISAPLLESRDKCKHNLGHILSCVNDPSGEKTGISEQLLQDFTLMSQYAAAAYCPENNNSPGTQVKCPQGNCPLVEAANATTMLEFENTKLTDTTGFVAVDDTNRLIILSFRGSMSWKNLNTDIDMSKVPTGWCDDCNAHEGFWDAWGEVREPILSMVDHALAEHPDYRIIVTGHSLGAAIATLAATDMRLLSDKYLKAVYMVSKI